MRISALIVALSPFICAASGAGSPVAIACDLHSRIEDSSGVTQPTVRERELTKTFVIDDQQKTLRGFDPGAVALVDFCPGCQLNFGLASITYSKVETAPRRGADASLLSYLSVYQFKLDRTNGTYFYSSHTDSLNRSGVSSKLYHDVTGSCRKTVMPSLVAPGAKF